MGIKNKICFAVSKFALPAPRKGSIELYSGLGQGSEAGIEIHQEIQSQRNKTYPAYISEVYISRQFDWDGHLFEISGRMDGFYDELIPQIEEIKSSFNIEALLRKLKENDDDHPYVLQLKTYGYFYWLENNKIPNLNLHLVCSHTKKSFDFGLELDVDAYEHWLNIRSKELIEDAKLAESRFKFRKKASKKLKLPFSSPRRGQIELINFIETGIMEKQSMMIQAPTGLGKTIGVLYPLLKEAFSRGQKLIYVTPKNSQHRIVEEEIVRLQKHGANFKSITLTAKSKICLKKETHCIPEYCEYAKDHYDKVTENKVIEKISEESKVTMGYLREIAQTFQVCPFEIQLDLAAQADVVICDYNYVFAPSSALNRRTSFDYPQAGKPNLIIDEAHNILSRSMEYYSSSLSSVSIKSFLYDLTEIPRKFQIDFRSLLDQIILLIEEFAFTSSKKPVEILPSMDRFLMLNNKIQNFFFLYLTALRILPSTDVILRLYKYWTGFINTLNFSAKYKEKFIITFTSNPAVINITCCDASEMLKKCYEDFNHIVAFSATLKPFDFYSKLSGLNDLKLKTIELPYPFSKSKRKIVIIPQLSSKYSDRERNYPRIAEAINKIASLKFGNYFVFCPSFEFIERVVAKFSLPEGCTLLKQDRMMSKDNINTLIKKLKTTHGNIIFAVQGGIFSEGIDYHGESLIGVFVVGVPLPYNDEVHKKKQEYYQKHYFQGFEYTFSYPAMSKSVQAAGRVIRSDTDRGIIILMDHRFLQSSFSKTLPRDWIEKNMEELISQNILNDITNFWSDTNT